MSNIDFQKWQQEFIATNLLALGYNTWTGYLGGDRGAIICDLNKPLLSGVGETFETHFVLRRRMAAFLNAWLQAPDTVILQNHHMTAHILQAVDSYDPTTEMILLMESGQQASFFYLRNLPMTPPQCYEQVCKGWEEFQTPTTELNHEKGQKTNAS